jgi:hypothetical protein
LSRYQFNLHGDHNTPDQDGCELPCMDDARGIAARYLGALIADAGPTLFENDDWHLDVTDDRGLILFTARVAGFSSAAFGSSSKTRAAASR